MRLDLFLKKTSLIKRRTVAKDIIEKGHTFVNGKVAKPSTDIKDGDLILLKLGPKSIEVKALITFKGAKENPDYEILKTEKVSNG